MSSVAVHSPWTPRDGWAATRDALANRLKLRAAQLCNRSNWSLLIELIRSHFQGTDQSSLFGVLWSLVSPIAMVAVLYSVFSQRFGAEIAAYPLYLLLGIVSVNFFTSTTRFMMTLLLAQRALLLNTTVPSETLIASRLAMPLYKLSVELLLCAGLSVYYGLFSWWLLPLLMPLLLAFLALSVGVGLILALTRAVIRDLDSFWGLVSRVLFFGTPIFYTLDNSSPTAAILYWLNPLTPFLASFRELFMLGAGVYGGWGAYGHSLALGTLLFAVGYAAFLLLQNAAVEHA